MSIFSSEEKNKKDTLNEKEWLRLEGQPVIDLYETSKDLILESPMAGVSPDDIEVFLEDDVLTVKGKREKLEEREKRNYFIQECYWGSFLREIILPVPVDGSKVKAELENGILKIIIPKLRREKRKRIEVREIEENSEEEIKSSKKRTRKKS